MDFGPLNQAVADISAFKSTHPYADTNITYDTYSGTDIVATILVPFETEPLVLGELQTISYSIHRENTPVRTLGNVNPRGFVKGPRTIAGSLIFTQFNQYTFYRLKQYRQLMQRNLYGLADMLPPFDVILSFSNESGAFSKLKIYGLSIVDEGATMSIDDLQVEQTFCVDTETEILTKRGWVREDQIRDDDDALTINPTTKDIEWQEIESVHRFSYDGDMVRWSHYRGLDALTTPNHRWLTTSEYLYKKNGFEAAPYQFRTTETVGFQKVYVGGGTPTHFRDDPVYDDEFVELVAFAVTEGHYIKAHNKGVHISQSEKVNPDAVSRLRDLIKFYSASGATASEYRSHRAVPYESCHDYYFGKGIGEIIRETAPDRTLPSEFLCNLTHHQAELLYSTMIACDGYSDKAQTVFVQKRTQLVDDFQMLCSMLGKRTSVSTRQGENMCQVNVYTNRFTTPCNWKNRPSKEHYKGTVWCPKTANMTWLARRNGTVYWTGNTYMARGIQPLTNYIPPGAERPDNVGYMTVEAGAAIPIISFRA